MGGGEYGGGSETTGRVDGVGMSSRAGMFPSRPVYTFHIAPFSFPLLLISGTTLNKKIGSLNKTSWTII